MKMRSAILILTLALAGCGVGRVGAPPAVFDLGLDARPTPQLPVREPIALVFSAVPALSDTGIVWRVGDSAAPKSYATYRWSSSPSDLVRQACSDTGTVCSSVRRFSSSALNTT